MNGILFAAALSATLSEIASAQVTIGDIGVTGFSTTAFAVFTPGPVVNGYATGGFGSGAVATTQSILHDRGHPNDFIVGGFGFIGRCTITGPGTVTYTLISNAFMTAAQMDWDASRQLVFADAGLSQVRRLDPMTGSIIDLSLGAQPWLTSLNAGAVQPATQDVVVGGLDALYRLPFGTSTGVLLVSGLGGFVTGVTFDPVTLEVIATVYTSGRLIRVSATGTVTDVIPRATIAMPNAVCVDENGDFVVGSVTGVYRVPRTGGVATFLAANTSPAGTVSGVSVARGNGSAIPFGQGCTGTHGTVTITATGPFTTGATLVSSSHNHAPAQFGVLVFGLGNTVYSSLPLPWPLDPLLGTSGCFLNASIDATVFGISNASSPADLSFSIALTGGFAGQRFFLQHACFEPVPGGLSWSPGLAVSIQ